MARKSFYTALSSALGREARRLGDTELINNISDAVESTGEYGFRRDLFVRHAMFETSGQSHTVYVIVDDEGTVEWTLDAVGALAVAARAPFGFAAYSYQSLLPLNQDDEAITDEVVNLLEQHGAGLDTGLTLIAGPSPALGTAIHKTVEEFTDCGCDCIACSELQDCTDCSATDEDSCAYGPNHAGTHGSL